MSNPELLDGWTEERLNSRCNVSYLTGRCAVLEELAGLLGQRAGEHYSHGQNSEAHTLRELSREVTKLATAERAQQQAALREHDRSYP